MIKRIPRYCSKLYFSSIATELKSSNEIYVPPYQRPSSDDINKLEEFISHSKRLFILTGAGISTESGIPDYRSEGVGLYARTTNRPMMYQEFLTNPKRYRMYWARNYIGWPTFSTFQPNATHKTFANWEAQRKVFWHVTQNVDSLLTKAGCELLSELHGCSARVVCIDCGYKDLTREQLQQIIFNQNPVWIAHSNIINPDADVYLTEEQLGDFKPPQCPRCSGRVKPDVTFFGDNVDRHLVAFIKEQLSKSDSVLVAGSSLEVMSSYRFILAAQQYQLPIAIVNIGRTRGDHAAQLKISTRCGLILPLIKINS
ncbi:unnamed protein product [Rotaria sordida]|uniref:Deacetylase sirtuin-type domain-containing protein n=1 Tax=Rotaria sordida TaxID=392033 RepID=A0A818LL14_9BILA|nr:unnamed protein product [Rotaria sordida]CAF0961824.1 unnamed protein product [Rotaria sordida]CAF3579804.1 unnamed protein product [Rotaria sordida]CAF3696159.1 unnamed protein product [Rotaria sordida]